MRSRRRGSPRAVGLIFTPIGAVALAVAAWSALDLWRFHQASVEVEGRVVEIARGCSVGRNSCSNRPVVEYEADGVAARITGTVGSNPPLWQPGEAVAVRYVPGAPGEARIYHWSEVGFAIGMGLLFALIFGGLGIAMLRTARRAAARAAGRSTLGPVLHEDSNHG